MLHDVIPLLHPDLVSGGGRLSQRWMLATVARHAAGLITTTDVAADAVMRALQPLIKRVVATKAIHLPVAPVFLNEPIPEDILSDVPYFVVCGAIEPRKNHRLLFRVWRRLVAERGAGAPRLLVVGTPAHKGEAILAELANGEFPRSHILSVRGLSSPGVRRLMGGARALLMPSFAEGFGLPIIEALSVGTPVLASDLPAHREVGGELACYLDPADEAAWLEAVRAILDAPAHVADLRRRIAGYRPLTSAGYFSRVGAFLEAIP
jgi:glycosyltransferase involved in cell wall biosynthesis